MYGTGSAGARRWRVLTGGALILALTLVAGCGKAAERAGEKVGEKIGEEIVSGVTGGGVQVDPGKQSMTLTDEETGEQIEVSLSQGVPANFPLPVPRGWRADEFIESESEDGHGWIGMFYFEGDIRAEAESYQQQLEGMGLEVETFVVDAEGEYSNLMGVAGHINGKYYGGLLAFAQEDGRNVVSITFGEAEEDGN